MGRYSGLYLILSGTITLVAFQNCAGPESSSTEYWNNVTQASKTNPIDENDLSPEVPDDEDTDDELPSRTEKPLAAFRLENESRLREEAKCHFSYVRQKHIAVVREDEGQHGVVVNLPYCDIITKKRLINASIQEGTRFEALRDTGVPYRGQGAMAIRVHGQKSGKLKDRFEYSIAPKDALLDDPYKGSFPEENLLNLDGETRYVGFAIRFDSNYEPPDLKSYVIHLQVHQRVGGDDGGPPLALKIKSTPRAKDPIRLQLAVRREEHKKAKKAGKPHASEELLGKKQPDSSLASGLNVERDRWYHVILRLEPRSARMKAGLLEMWIDGQKIYSGRKHWGYEAPEEKNRKFSVKVGAYRRRHERNTFFRLDEVRYGNTYESVVPAKL